jgi:superfamily II DNA or RNA helicase
MPLNLLNEQVYYEHSGNPSWDLVILDEAHHARRQSPQNRKETPHRLLQLMQQLK